MKIITIVTAASSNHFKSVCQFLKSVPSSLHTIFYDIGLNQEEVATIKSEFPTIVFRTFNFDKYPTHVRLTSPDAGAYAWKPIIIHEVYREMENGVLLWCDAGIILHNNILECVEIVIRNKLFSARTSGTLAQWTHPTTCTNLGVPTDMLHRDMRNASFVGILCNDHLMRSFVKEWYHSALIKDIILPIGATRDNHRHDQSILTYLYYKYKINPVNHHIGYSIHNDID